MAVKRDDKLVEEIRFNEKYAHLLLSDYKPETYDSASIPTIKKKTLFTEDFVKSIATNGIGGSILPPNCRYIEETDKGFLVVVEEPPAYRTIKTRMGMSKELKRLKNAGKLEMYGYENWSKENSPPYKFTLAFPYVIFILYITKLNEVYDGQVFLRTKQMSGLSDYLLKIPMSNISDSGHVCFGSKISEKALSLTAAIQHAIMVWWSAEFNTDYMYNYNAYDGVPVVGSYLEWQYMGQVNPMFIYNADWIKCPYTIGQRLEITKEHLSIRSKTTMGYKELAEVFSTPKETGVEKKISKRSKKTKPLFYDIAQGTYLNSSLNISIGDSFTTAKGKTAFVSSFVGFPDGSEPIYIQLDIDGHTSLMKMNKGCRKFLTEKIKEQRHASQVELPNKQIIKPGQIVSVKLGPKEMFYKVDYIRKSRGVDDEEIHEIKMGNNYFLSSTINAKIFDVKNPVIDDVKIEKDVEYIIVPDDFYNAAGVAYKMKFQSIDVSGTQTIVAKFNNCHRQLKSHYKRLQLSNGTAKIIETKNVRPMPGIFRVGRRVFYIPDGRGKPANDVAWAYNGILLHDSNFSFNTAKYEKVKTLLNKDRFFIPGPDFDTEFVIGDKVVVANWDNPLDVLTVKMIQGFKYDESNHKISFILMDKEGKISETVYVDGNNGTIATGRVRKVTNKIGRISAGTKIQATTAGIPCFPKKDVNIIVAFIIDAGEEPMVLCSNGCTLWYSDVVEHFKRTTLKSKKWPTMDHAPLDLSKIKFQAGDIINGMREYKTSYGYLLHGPSSTRALRAMPIEYMTGHPESYTLDRYMTRDCRLDCIPAPRVTPSKIEQVGILRGLFNMHTYDVFENASIKTRYLNQRRS